MKTFTYAPTRRRGQRCRRALPFGALRVMSLLTTFVCICGSISSLTCSFQGISGVGVSSVANDPTGVWTSRGNSGALPTARSCCRYSGTRRNCRRRCSIDSLQSCGSIPTSDYLEWISVKVTSPDSGTLWINRRLMPFLLFPTRRSG